MSRPTDPQVPEGVTPEAWAKIARPDGPRWAIDERDANGEVIGTAYRYSDGRKDFKRGARRGLIASWPLDNYAGTSRDNPIFITEGASDTAALMGLGLDVIGIPAANLCIEMLAAVLPGLHIVIVEDADDAGASTTRKIVEHLARKCESLRKIAPPNGSKDARDAVIAGADAATFLSLAFDAVAIKPEAAPIDGMPVLIQLSEVKPELVDWLWPGRFAVGKLTLVAGDPGLGKSFLTLDMAARVSRGLPWPDSPQISQSPGGVILLNAEDGVADTIVPRLIAAGADLRRIVAIEAIRTVTNGRTAARTFDLSKDLQALEQAIISIEDCRLVVIDPLTAYLGGTDSHKNAEIRGLLAPFAELAARHKVAIVAVTHLNKSGGGPAIYRAIGSLAFAAAARAAWAVSKDKDDEGRRLLLPIKNNLAPDTGGLAYRIEPGVGGSPIVVWEADAVNLSADDALGSDSGDSVGTGALEEATEWLRDVLSDGARAAKEVKALAESDGIKPRTLDRAKKSLGVVADREGYSVGGRWVWSIPQSAPTEPKNVNLKSKAHKDDSGALCTTSNDRETL